MKDSERIIIVLFSFPPRVAWQLHGDAGFNGCYYFVLGLISGRNSGRLCALRYITGLDFAWPSGPFRAGHWHSCL